MLNINISVKCASYANNANNAGCVVCVRESSVASVPTTIAEEVTLKYDCQNVREQRHLH